MKKILYILLAISLQSFGAEYFVDKNKENSLVFVSVAPMEKIEGTSKNIDGYIKWDDQKPLQNNEFYFEVDLNEFDTGIGLRNRHMRENYLETDKYQFAILRGTMVKVDTLEANKLFNVTVNGTMSLHGVERPCTIYGQVTKADNNLKVTSNFQIRLSEHRIKIPQMIFLKLNDMIDIFVDFNLLKQ